MFAWDRAARCRKGSVAKLVLERPCQGTGKYECDVSINEYSYVGIIEFALAVWWDMDNGKSKMRKNLRKLGVKSDNSMIYMSALSQGFCVYLKEGIEAGIKEVKKYSN